MRNTDALPLLAFSLGAIPDSSSLTRVVDRARTMDEPPRTRARLATMHGGKILVVEDDADVREMLGSLLEDAGYAVVTAENGDEALTQLRSSSPPMLMLLDMMMPVMDGWAFIEARRLDPALLAIPVVIMSAVAGSSRAVPYPGISAIIEKPFDPAIVLHAIERFGLRRRRA